MEKHEWSGMMILYHLYSLAPGGGPVVVSQNDVARDTGLARVTVQRQFRRLVAAGSVVVANRGTSDHTPTEYVLPVRTEKPQALLERAVVEAMDRERRAQRAQLEMAVGTARATLRDAVKTLRDAAERLDGIANRLSS